jgi:dihydrofolate synthase/folylpolyglutamate synthase
MSIFNERYLNALKRLYNTNKFKLKKVDLEGITRACELFGNPQKCVNYIHVTGTNGKGSVCKKLSSIFTKGGFKTGLFISPHITTFRERIQVSNNYIEVQYITEELERIYKVCDSNSLDITYFEIVTLLGLNYFKDMKTDIAVMEVGLGGNLDATNVINPLLSAVTSIGLDHTDSLGFTQEEIAEKKAGIIKPGKPVVIGYDCYPKNVFIERARETKSEIYFVEKSKKDKSAFFDFDIENRDIAKCSINVLKKQYPNLFSKLDDTAIQYGLSQCQPCRKEDTFISLGKDYIINHIKQNFNREVNLNNIKAIYLDVGHNQHGLEKLFLSLRELYPANNFRVICGFSFNKDKLEILKTLFSYADKVYPIASDHPRIMKYADLKEYILNFLKGYSYSNDILEDNDLNGNVKENICKAIDDCSQSGNKDEIIIICGSFFLMKDARDTLGFEDESDPFELNEMHIPKFN